MLKKVRLLCLLAVIVCLGAAVACGAMRYNVDFYVDGELYATVGTDGERIAMPQDPEKDGQIFLGWYLSEDGEGEALTIRTLLEQPLTESVHLKVYAVFGEGYVITFVTGTTETVKSQTVAAGKTAEEVTPKQIPKGKIFGGWYTDEQFTQKWDFSQKVREDKVLYAQWLSKTVTVTYDFGESGEADKTVQLSNGEYAEEVVPQKTVTGKEFVGWYTDANCTKPWYFTQPVTQDLTLYAYWAGEYVTVTYDFNAEGFGKESVEVRRGERIDLLTPDRAPDFCAFGGWYRDAECTQEWRSYDRAERSMTLYAKWDDITGSSARVMYIGPNGQTMYRYASVGDKAEQISISLPEGYRLVGWYRDENYTKVWDFSTDRIAQENLTLYAKTEIIRSTIYFVSDTEAQLPEPLEVVYGQTVIFTYGFKENHIQIGIWKEYDENGELLDYYSTGIEYTWKRTEDVTLTAEFVNVFTFHETQDGAAYTVTGTVLGNIYYRPIQYELIVPGEYNGKPVVAVEASAFTNCDVERIVLSEGIRTVGAEAFHAVYSLRELVIASSVEELSRAAFEDCHSLREIKFSQDAKLHTVGASAFQGCSSLREIVLPDSVREIGSAAFYECSGLEQAELSCVQTIGDSVFGNCTELKEITIPETVTAMGGNVFSRYSTAMHDLIIYVAASERPEGWKENWNSGLTVVWNKETASVFEQGDYRFLVQDGEATVLRYIVFNESAVLPSSVRYGGQEYPVTGIGNYAFEYKENLTDVSLPSTIERVGKNIFYRTENLNFTQDNGALYLGNAENPYLILAGFDSGDLIAAPLTVRSGTRIILDESTDDFDPVKYDYISDLEFEEGIDLLYIGDSALYYWGSEAKEVRLPSGIGHIGKYSVNWSIIYVEEAALPEGWHDQWCGTYSRVYWDAGNTRFETEDGLYVIEGDVATLAKSFVDTEDAYILPEQVSFGGKTYPVRIGRSALTFMRCRILFIPESVAAVESNNVPYANIGLICVAAQQVPAGWDQDWNQGSIRTCFGVTPETFAEQDGVQYILHDTYAEAYYYTGSAEVFALPRSVEAGGVSYPVSAVAGSFIRSLHNIHIVFFDSVQTIPAGKYYANNVRIYTTCESAPAGWEEGWNATYGGEISVMYGLTGVDGTLHTYTFVTEGTSVPSMTAVMLPAEPQTEMQGMYFWGWYDNRAFEGSPLEFPYTGTAYTLYARFETEQIRDGKSFQTAFALEEGTQTSVTIEKPGRSVYFVFTVAKGMSKDYIIKSTGDFDTYGVLYNRNYTQIGAADGGGSGENFSISCSLGSISREETYYIEVKLLDKTQTGSFMLLLSRV